jgi:hypothetical protein
VRYAIILTLTFLSSATFAEDAIEAASSCVVIQKKADAGDDDTMTCFENIALERSSFESGVCRWQTDAQEAAQAEVITRFVPSCPLTYSAYCDRLVLGPAIIVPVKIFIYDQSSEVLERARKQCLSGGGHWNSSDKVAEPSVDVSGFNAESK